MALIAVGAGIAGVILVLSPFADMLNTLVATHTSRRRSWFSHQQYLRTWHATRLTVLRIHSEWLQHTLLRAYAPLHCEMMPEARGRAPYVISRDRA